MPEYRDRVKDQTQTTGTGTLTIDGVAATGYRTITAAHTTGSSIRYTVINATASEWEVGEGVWTAASNTLTRATVYSSSNAGSLVNFSAGAKVVFTGPVAQDLNDLAPKASPALTGTPTAPTAAADTNTTQISTTAFVVGQASSTTPVVDGTAAVGTSLKFARADHVHPTDTSRAPLASPTFTGTPVAPTAAVDTNTTQIATTAYVVAQGYLKSATASSTYLALSGGALTGGLREARVAMPANDINLNSGNYFTKTISGATSLTVSNVPSAGTAASFILDLTNGGSATITWWSGTKWAGGTAPTLTSAGRDVLGFFTHDGGTTWSGLVLGKDVK